MADEHLRIVKEAVEGKRDVDERTLTAIEVLDERLQRLRKMDKIFDEVKFSSAVKRILTRQDLLTVR
jgi:hypothetical protein